MAGHGRSWPEGAAPRRSISTVVRPIDAERFYQHHSQHFQGRQLMPDGTVTPSAELYPYLNGGLHHLPQHPQHQARFYHEEPAAYCTPVQAPFDPRRFSPPQLDTPPATQENRSFSFDGSGPPQQQQQQPWHHANGMSPHPGQQGGGGGGHPSGPLSDPSCIGGAKQDPFGNSPYDINRGIARMSFPPYDPSSPSKAGLGGHAHPSATVVPMHCAAVSPYHRMSQQQESLSPGGGGPGQVQQQQQGSTDDPNSLLGSLQKRPFAADKARTTSLSGAQRKPSWMAQRSQLRSPRVSIVTGPTSAQLGQLTPYTPPPILSPVRSGSGLYCSIAGGGASLAANGAANGGQLDSPTADTPPMGGGGGDGEGPSSGGSPMDTGSEAVRKSSGKIKMEDDDGVVPRGRPQRKNGFYYSGVDEFDLDALRKDSWASSSSAKSVTSTGDRKGSHTTTAAAPPGQNGTSAGTVPASGAPSATSIPETAQEAATRKASSVSDSYYDSIPTPQETDATPHINIGRDYQARVKKWSTREITQEELDAIPDRDEPVFDCRLIDHLSEEQMNAYEYLAQSAALPRFGKNKELALHLLMENKGNMESAVMDLLRSDTLDWELYPIIYNYLYNDSTHWSPEQITSFADALYKTEKDFHQVAQEIGLPVKVCVEWYYTWKKCLPDDYRKLRNLRRKRRLLEQQMGIEQQAMILMGQPVAKSAKMEEEDDDECSMSGFDMFAAAAAAASAGVHGGVAGGGGGGVPGIMAGALSSNAAVAASMASLQQQQQQDSRPRMNSFTSSLGGSVQPPGASPVHKSSNGSMYPATLSPLSELKAGMYAQGPMSRGGMGGMLSSSSSASAAAAAAKKGAQPAADGFFHCRLCDKCFEKVKSLNAHMKSHAMKARAEAEARSQGFVMPADGGAGGPLKTPKRGPGRPPKYLNRPSPLLSPLSTAALSPSLLLSTTPPYVMVHPATLANLAASATALGNGWGGSSWMMPPPSSVASSSVSSLFPLGGVSSPPLPTIASRLAELTTALKTLSEARMQPPNVPPTASTFPSSLLHSTIGGNSILDTVKPAAINMDAQLQQLGLNGLMQLSGMNGFPGLTASMQQSPQLQGLHITPSLGIH